LARLTRGGKISYGGSRGAAMHQEAGERGASARKPPTERDRFCTDCGGRFEKTQPNDVHNLVKPRAPLAFRAKYQGICLGISRMWWKSFVQI